MPVTKSNAIRDELTILKDTDGLSFRRIVQMPRFRGIPIQTLSMIYLGKRDVPKKYRKRLGVPETAPAPVCLVHGVVHCYDCRTQTVKAKSKPRRRKWRDVKTSDLLAALQNRHEPYWKG